MTQASEAYPSEHDEDASQVCLVRRCGNEERTQTETAIRAGRVKNPNP